MEGKKFLLGAKCINDIYCTGIDVLMTLSNLRYVQMFIRNPQLEVLRIRVAEYTVVLRKDPTNTYVKIEWQKNIMYNYGGKMEK